MKKLLILIIAALAISGCAQLQKFEDAISIMASSKVSPTAVIVAVNSFDAVEVSATNYISLPKCTATNGPICRNAAATAQIIKVIRSGRIARNNLLQLMKDHPGELATQGLYDALNTAIDTVKAVYSQYNVTT